MEEKSLDKKMLNIKNIIRLLAAIVTLFFFIPMFTVSCSEDAVADVSAIHCLTGRYNGDEVSSVHPAVILLLLLPIAIIVIWSLKGQINNRVKAIVSTSCAGVDFFGWIILSSSVHRYANDNYCEFSNKFTFWLNLLLIIGIIALSIPLIIGKLAPDDPPDKLKSLASQTKKSISDKKPAIKTPENPA